MARAAAPSGVHIEHFIKGLVTNRAAISVPFRFTQMGQVIQYMDALIDGLNVEISPKNTLWRRPGWTKFCSAQLASSETVNGFTGVTLSGTAYTLASTNQNVYEVGSAALTSLYTKTTSLQTFFQQVGEQLYFSDGTINQKWDGLTVTNNGLVAPVNAPTVPNLNWFDSSGGTQTCHAWVPGAVYNNTTASAVNYFLMAPTGEIFWSVVPAGTKLSSQTSTPNWSAQYGTFGGVVQDGTMTWTDCGLPGTWAASTVYQNSAYSTTATMNAQNSQNTQTTSGSTSFNWTTTSTSIGFTEASGGTTGDTNTLTVTGLGFAIPSGATIKGITVRLYRGANRTNAVQDVTVQLLKAGTAVGNNKAASGYWPQILWNAYNIPTIDGLKQDYGSNTDLWGTTWSASDINNTNFGIKIVASQNSSSRTSAAITYNSQNSSVTALFTITYTPGSSAVSGTYFGNIITDSNGNLQLCKVGGTSGASAPSWSTTIGGTTTDNTVTWICLGTASQLPCLFNRTYAYGFHSSGATDHISTMSPTLILQAPIIGVNVPVQGYGSDDTQVDSNDLYRTADGGSLLLYDNSSPNVNSSTSWTINDVELDTDLDAELIGPVAFANNPPPTGATILGYFMDRMWAAVGQYLYFSAGPDCINGDGNQAWPPANVFTLSSNITGMAATSQGLLVFTGNDMSIVLGGPQTDTFWVQPLQKNFGILSPNCLVQDGDTIYLYSSQQQLWSISASSGKSEISELVAATIATNFPSATSSLALHRDGEDQGLFISDGSGKTMRYNLNSGSWDPIAEPANGIGQIASIPTAIGTQSLLSANASNGYIVFRDTTTFSDAGTAYAAWAVIGSLPFSQGGEDNTGKAEKIVIQSAATGTALQVWVLPNEISGTFTQIPQSVNDPSFLAASSTINMKRYDWNGVQTPLPNALRHMQVKIVMPSTDTVQNEIFGVHIT